MIQAAFFDIDGTLLDHTDGKSVFPQSTAAALAALQRKGVKVFVSTGRAPAMLDSVRGLSPSIRELFPFDGFATFNGQLVLERDGTVIHRMSHDPENIRKLIPLAQKEQFPCFVLEEVESFPLTDHPSIRQHYQSFSLTSTCPLRRPFRFWRRWRELKSPAPAGIFWT